MKYNGIGNLGFMRN